MNKRILVPTLLMFFVLLVGCGQQTSSAQMAKPAPPPSNLTPEQRRDFEEAVKRTHPPAAPTIGK